MNWYIGGVLARIQESNISAEEFTLPSRHGVHPRQSEQRQQLREESKRLTRLLKQSRQQLAVETRREELAKDRRRRVGLRILAIASDALTFLKSYLKSELSTVSELVADSEYEEI